MLVKKSRKNGREVFSKTSLSEKISYFSKKYCDIVCKVILVAMVIGFGVALWQW